MQRVLLGLESAIEFENKSITLLSSPRFRDSECHTQIPAALPEFAPTCTVCHRTKNLPPFKFRLCIKYNWDNATKQDSELED